MTSLSLPIREAVLLRASPGEATPGSRRCGLQPCYWLYGDFSTDQVVRQVLRLRLTPKIKRTYFLPNNHALGQRGSTASPELQRATQKNFFFVEHSKRKNCGKGPLSEFDFYHNLSVGTEAWRPCVTRCPISVYGLNVTPVLAQ